MQALDTIIDMADYKIAKSIADFVSDVVESFDPDDIDEDLKQAVAVEVIIRKASGVGAKVR